MQRLDHPLLSQSIGSQKTLSSFHFGVPGLGRKIYIQASLHAEELPGMLVLHHLRGMLEAAEQAGHLAGTIVLVPVANPIGLAQRLDRKPMGRFELGSSENFNRHYPDLTRAITPAVVNSLGPHADVNVSRVRAAIGAYLSDWTPSTELQSLRRTLLTLAYDADQVLDLHCESEAVMHVYCEEACWHSLMPLAHFLEAEAVLLADKSGGGPFDECLSGVWSQLGKTLRTAGRGVPLPQACCATTIELRGEADVSHVMARQDAQAIFDYLCHLQVIAQPPSRARPAAKCQPTPLAGSETLCAPVAGVLAFCADVGQTLRVGDVVAEIVNPITNQTHPVCAGVEGVFYARTCDRYVTTGGELGKIAGRTPFRTGPLIGA